MLICTNLMSRLVEGLTSMLDATRDSAFDAW
jgi:hypothetical protein